MRGRGRGGGLAAWLGFTLPAVVLAGLNAAVVAVPAAALFDSVFLAGKRGGLDLVPGATVLGAGGCRWSR